MSDPTMEMPDDLFPEVPTILDEPTLGEETKTTESDDHPEAKEDATETKTETETETVAVASVTETVSEEVVVEEEPAPAPVAPTPAPIETPAPAKVTPAPVVSTPAPVVATPAPVASTASPSSQCSVINTVREALLADSQYGLPHYTPEKQKPLSQLNFSNLLMWRNVYASAAVLLTIQALYVLLVCYKFSVLTLVTRLMLIQVALFFIYHIAMTILTNKVDKTSSFAQNLVIDVNAVEPYIKSALNNINKGVHFYLHVLRCENLLTTIQFAAGLQVVCWFSQIFSGINVLYITSLFAFVLPRAYEFQRANVDKYAAIAASEINTYAKLVFDKIPKASTAAKVKKE